MLIPPDEHRARCDLRWSLILVMAYIFILLATWAICGRADTDTDTDARAINAYIDYTHRLVRPSKARKAKRFTPAIVSESRQRGLDPFLVAVVFFLESGLRPDATGSRGERGLSQVMPRFCKKSEGCDLSTPEGQIRAGTTKLKAAFDKCGNVLGALTYYSTGNTCTPRTELTRKKMQFRVKYYKRMKARFGDAI